MLDSPLLRNVGGFVAGQWTGAESGRTISVCNPATGEPLANVPDMGRPETSAAIAAAAAALDQAPSLADRGQWLTAIAQAIADHKPELARIITLEQGKPLREAAEEVEYSAGFFTYCATQLSRLAPHRLGEPIRDLSWTIQFRPAGVVGLITPWNFPLAMLAKKLAPAIGAGCTIVAKPAEATPLTAIALWNLLERTGMPPGRANLVIGRPAAIGETLCTDPAVRVISFTGSTTVGKLLLQQAAPHVKRLTLELGGNAPFIVLDDSRRRCGRGRPHRQQIPLRGPNLRLRQPDLRPAGDRRPVRRSRGRPRFKAPDRQRPFRGGGHRAPDRPRGGGKGRSTRARRHDARRKAPGRDRAVTAGSGSFYPPTVLVDTTAAMLLSQEETFGPVVAIRMFEHEDEAIALANGTPCGLAAYLFTRDAGRANRLMQRLVFGHIGWNTGMGQTPEAPFGGMKESGIGREGGLEGLLEFCEQQTVVHP